jgi:Bacterial CdiA-CT RNAse A domain
VRSTQTVCILGLLLLMGGCGNAPEPGLPEIPHGEIPKAARDTTSSGRYDLERDEARGGHTLEKHVGRTDDELRERLERERNISGASTWANREVAEETVGEALRHEQNQIERWESRGDRRTNLALHYDAGHVIGRSMRHGDTASSLCTDAVIVLKADGANGFYVLTTYPEERQ